MYVLLFDSEARWTCADLLLPEELREFSHGELESFKIFGSASIFVPRSFPQSLG